MEKPDAAARAAAIFDRAQKEMREVAESPEIAKGVVGEIVFDLIRSGEEVTLTAILAVLESAAGGQGNRGGVHDVLAKGALKVIADLRGRPGG